MANPVILHPRDVYNQYVLTKIVEKRASEHEIYKVPFAPLISYDDRQVLIHVTDYRPSGLAPFKADEGSTPVLQTGGKVEERRLDLVVISEEAVIRAKTMLHLASSDENIRRGAAQDIVGLGRTLRVRNTQRTMWMAWQAVQDNLSITYPDGGAISIDFDLDASSHNDSWSGSHVVTPSTDWDDASADIIGDIETWTELIEDDHGADQSTCILHLNGKTWRQVKENTAIQAELSGTQPRITTPKADEVAEILGIAELRLINDYYKDTSRTKHKFLDDGKALLTAPYTWNGDNIMEMMDGPVVLVSGDDLVVANNPGAQSEIWVDKGSTTKKIRVTTARMPVLHYPEAFVWASVYTA